MKLAEAYKIYLTNRRNKTNQSTTHIYITDIDNDRLMEILKAEIHVTQSSEITNTYDNRGHQDYPTNDFNWTQSIVLVPAFDILFYTGIAPTEYEKIILFEKPSNEGYCETVVFVCDKNDLDCVRKHRKDFHKLQQSVSIIVSRQALNNLKEDYEVTDSLNRQCMNKGEYSWD